MDTEKPPTQHIKAAPAIDPQEYMEGEFRQCKRQYGEPAMIFMENLVAAHMMMRMVSLCLADEDLKKETNDELGKILAQYNAGQAQRAARLAELDQQMCDAVVVKALEVVDCLDTFEQASSANLH